MPLFLLLVVLFLSLVFFVVAGPLLVLRLSKISRLSWIVSKMIDEVLK